MTGVEIHPSCYVWWEKNELHSDTVNSLSCQPQLWKKCRSLLWESPRSCPSLIPVMHAVLSCATLKSVFIRTLNGFKSSSFHATWFSFRVSLSISRHIICQSFSDYLRLCSLLGFSVPSLLDTSHKLDNRMILDSSTFERCCRVHYPWKIHSRLQYV